MQVAQGGLALTLMHPDELRRRLAKGEVFSIIDARRETTLRASGRTVVGSIRIPRRQLRARRNEIPRGRALVLLADLPEQERIGFELLEEGYTDVCVLVGGFDAYVRAGGPTEPV